MTSDDREIVSTIRARLAQRIGSDRYEVWFGPATQISVRGESLVVSVPTQFFQDWLRTNFRRDLEAAALEACGRPLVLEFRIAPAALIPPVAKPAAPPGVVSPAVAQSPVAPAKPADPPPFAPRRKLSSLDGFVVGNSNCLAHKAAQMSVAQPGSYSPLLVHGPTGTGKTHLLEGIYSAFRKSRPRGAAVYLSAEQFTSDFLQALHKSGMAMFRGKYRDLELLVIDDLQFLAGKRATISELQHTIDTLLRAGKQLVFAADRAPAALKVLGPELVSRLSGGMVCRLEPAEYATRLGIVRNHAIELGLEVPDDVQAYVASRLTSQSRELIGALKRLKAMSLAHAQPITLTLAEEALAELIDHQLRPVKLADIEKAVCDVYGLDADSLQTARKAKVVSEPRMLAMYLARKYTRAPLTEIGSYFGRRSHSTVISAQKKVESWITTATEGAKTLEEMIRRVEEQLRAG